MSSPASSLQPTRPPRSPAAWLAAFLWLLLLGLATPARAILFYDTADPNHNTIAPGGIYENSGWQYQGIFGDNLGTAIGQHFFITAAHVPVESTFVQLGLFTGGVDTTFNVDSSAFGGVGYFTIAGTDLRIYQVVESFSNWAPLYTGTTEITQTMVTMGLGGARGAAVELDTGMGLELKGWLGTQSDGTARWGTNIIDGVVPDMFSPVGDLLVAHFDAMAGTDEAVFTGNDSGGGVFILDGGIWKLAGVNYSVDGAFNTIPSDTGAFNGALFDKGGYYEGQGFNWSFNPDTPVDAPQALYMSRISSSASAIQAIVSVPEPGSALLTGLALPLLFLVRRRRCCR